MSAEIVQAKYGELDAIAKIFGQYSEQTSDLNRQVQARMQDLQQGGWQGKGAAAFFSEMEQETLPAVQRLSHALTTAKSTVFQIKASLQEAERNAAAPFQGDAASLGVGSSTTAGEASVSAGGFMGQALAAASTIGNIMKGIAADTLIPQRFVLRALTPNLSRGQSTVAALMDMLAGKPGRGLPLIRFDGPHKGTPFPHINLNPKLTGVRDPHIPISPKLLNVVGKGARILEGARKIALPVAIMVDAFRIGSAFHSDGNQIGVQTKQTVGSVAGGWAGAAAGAKAGAVGGAWLGGIIGSAVPVVGTAVGAGVGGFLGGLGGAIGGSMGGSWIGEKIGGLF